MDSQTCGHYALLFIKAKAKHQSFQDFLPQWNSQNLAPGKCTSGAYFFALAAMNGPLTAELKFRENTAMLTHSEQKKL